MPTRHVKLLFTLALLASLLIHATLLLLAGVAFAREQGQLALLRTDPILLTLPQEMQLGIDAQTPPSETWLGFEKPKPQFAPPSIVDQAAFTEDPIAATPPPSETSPIEATLPVPVDPPDTAQTQAPPTEPVAKEPPEPEQSPPHNETHPVETRALSENDPADFTHLLESLGLVSPSDAPASKSPSESESQQPPPKPAPAAASSPPKPASESPPTNQAIAPHPVSGAPNDGAQSDKDSSASSIIDVPRDQWQRGKPVAAHGLELKPQRPEFTVLTMLTAAPSNPLCLIKFGRDGVPVKADLVESSGDSRVDEAIKASLYRWRASGKELARLAKDETADVTMRIILTRSRRS